MKGRLVIVDGMDASGKSVILGSLESWAKSYSMKILNLERYYEEKKCFPTEKEIEEHEVIVSAEPSPFYVGRAIKEELILPSERAYSALSIAQAFALDREILYKKIIIPALKMGKFVFQDRGIATSFVYQPIQGRIPLDELMRLPGNRLAMEYAPELLILTKVSSDVVMRRIEERNKARTIFENLLFQRKIEERYGSVWLRQLFENSKSTVAYLDTNPPKGTEEVSREAIMIWEDFLKKKKPESQ